VATAGKIQDLEEKLSKKQTAMIKINELRGELERAKQLLASLTRELFVFIQRVYKPEIFRRAQLEHG